MKIINRPVRVAIVGSGPSGFFAASALCDAEIEFEIDIFEKLFAPYGLVRYGVAPDHQNIKNIVSKFSQIAQSPKISFTEMSILVRIFRSKNYENIMILLFSHVYDR